MTLHVQIISLKTEYSMLIFIMGQREGRCKVKNRGNFSCERNRGI